MRALTSDHRAGRGEQDFEVGHHRVIPGVAKIEAHHLVERGLAAARHLPQTRDTGPGFEHAAAVPALVGRHLVGQRRTRADERHLALDDVPELRQLVEAGPAKEVPDWRHPRIVDDLEHPVAGSRGLQHQT